MSLKDGNCKELTLHGYHLQKVIGKGAFGTVYECGKIYSRKTFAAKLVEADVNTTLKLHTENEIEILKDLNSHRHIVQLLAVVRDNGCIIQILEFIPGSTFLKGIYNWPRFREHNLKSALKQILSALDYCQSKRVVHRDICPENIMWYQIPTARKPNQVPVLKLIDFNLAMRLPEHTKALRAEPLGNPSYMAPECLQEKSVVTFTSDIWSVGVIAFTLMAGYPPFWSDNYNHLLENITEANYVFADSLWKHVSSDGKDFVKRTLCKDTFKRSAASELLFHKWLRSVNADEENVNWVGHTRLKSFLQTLEEKRKRNPTRKCTLIRSERIAFIPDDNMFKHSLAVDLEKRNNLNRRDEENLFYHW